MIKKNFYSIFGAYAYAYSETCSHPKQATLRSPCHHQLFAGIYRVRTEKFRSRILSRLEGVTLTAKDRASARPFLPFSKWNCAITFRFTLSTSLCDVYIFLSLLFYRIFYQLEECKQNVSLHWTWCINIICTDSIFLFIDNATANFIEKKWSKILFKSNNSLKRQDA